MSSRPAALSINQVLAWWDADARHYTAYTTRVQTSPITGVSATQAAADSGGTWTDLEIGHSTYKFKTVLPEGYDVTKTHTLAVYATRNIDDFIGKNYYDNVEHDFRPDGGSVTETWDKTTNAACNQCHDLLSAHGGSRQDVKLCVTCHQPQTVDPDTGNTVDFKVMVHKIHTRLFAPERRSGNALHHHRQQPVGPRLLGRRLPAGHPQLRPLPHARGDAVERLVHVPVPRGVRLLPRQHRLGDGREPSGGPAGERRRLRVVPPAGRLPRIRRVDHRGAHGALQVDAAEGPERRDRVGRRTPRRASTPR